tara:strand:+ start:6708 stop:7793 length:1086 start_codon:yes stop_codon:yes gene_type:complete
MKISEFQDKLNTKKIDLAILFNQKSMSYVPSLFYFTNYSGVGALTIPNIKAPFFLVPKMEFDRAKVSIKNTGQIKSIIQLDKKRFLESISLNLRKRRINIKKIGLEMDSISVNTLKSFKKFFKNKQFVDVSELGKELRITKTPKELGFLKKSSSLADKILQKTLKTFKDFKTESDVSSFLEYQTKKLGLNLSFPPIVASGANSSMPHYEPQNTKLKPGFCVVDFGVKYRGYCSDMTRTLFIGKPTQKEKKIYGFVLEVQKNTINQIEEGKLCSELYEFALNKLGKYKNYFTHGLGHGVGVEIHELPNLTLNSQDKILKNTVFTIEPGIYIPNKFGIRIEDTISFQNKTKRFTKSTKDLLIF